VNLINIKATTLPDAWFQAVYACLDHGRRFKIDQGSYAGQERLELDYVTIHIENPGLRDVDGWPLIPEMPEGCTVPPPVARDFLPDYANYLMTGEKKAGEQYTYGNRIWAYEETVAEEWGYFSYKGWDQVALVVDRYKRLGHRNNQLVLQVAQIQDLGLDDPPCLRAIDTRVQDGKLHFFITFRSWDLWGGLPANLAGISMLHEYMATEIGVEMGEVVCNTKGLHLYDYVVELAKLRCGK
jgi:thymidylate synthase